MSVQGQVVLITGAAQGLGKGFANILLKNGCKVALTDIAQGQGEKTLAEFKKAFGDDKVIFIKVDVTSQADMEYAFQKTKDTFHGLDIVVNNAGIGGEGDSMWEKCVDINLKGTIRGTRLALSYLRKDRGGKGGIIINVSSAGGLCPQSDGAVYCGTKSGVIMYSRSIAADAENHHQGIRIYTLCPAFVDTPMVETLISGTTSSNTESARKKVEEVGIMSVEEVAGAFYSQLVKEAPHSGAVLFISKRTGHKFLNLDAAS